MCTAGDGWGPAPGLSIPYQQHIGTPHCLLSLPYTTFLAICLTVCHCHGWLWPPQKVCPATRHQFFYCVLSAFTPIGLVRGQVLQDTCHYLVPPVLEVLMVTTSSNSTWGNPEVTPHYGGHISLIRVADHIVCIPYTLLFIRHLLALFIWPTETVAVSITLTQCTPFPGSLTTAQETLLMTSSHGTPAPPADCLSS